MKPFSYLNGEVAQLAKYLTDSGVLFVSMREGEAKFALIALPRLYDFIFSPR
ncbi:MULTISPECIES: hypothetical protein [Paraburkholderia]|uniref:hypothetical protein n=1 Tax=Paraburkholderia TaxID=1822464 RepID=UPI0014211FCC|nr:MULTISPECIES: hypothetical protein [Paraburkholderia]GJH05687.1 hypothetical protein CBA19C8_34040 [Paraburkholderia terrae]